jgi:hypothetical protein
MGFFSWLRKAARDAIISGINDAAEELHSAAGGAGDGPPVQLRLTFAPASAPALAPPAEADEEPEETKAKRTRQR